MRDSAGKKNVPALEKQLDDVAYASYLVGVGMVEDKVQLLTMLDQGSDAKRALDREEEWEKAFSSGAGRSAAEKKASDERVKRITDAKSRIDASINEGKKLTEGLEDRIKASQKAYDTAYHALIDVLAQKAKEQRK
jgi:hypothetical protein